jgi:AcrR family transcriptional regulator
MAGTEGLRERKKRETREAIARAAWKLFNRRGFDAVTVADIAAEAGVSEKTVFNYFPAKEDLVFGAGIQRTAKLIEAVEARPAGTSIVEPFRRWTMDYLDRVEHAPVDSITAIPRLVMRSDQLRARLFIGWEQEAAMLGPVIAQQVGEPEDGVVPVVVARTLAWTHRVVFRAAFTRLIEGEDQAKVAADLREQATAAYDLLERGLADYGADQDGAADARQGPGIRGGSRPT